MNPARSLTSCEATEYVDLSLDGDQGGDSYFKNDVALFLYYR